MLIKVFVNNICIHINHNEDEENLPNFSGEILSLGLRLSVKFV